MMIEKINDDMDKIISACMLINEKAENKDADLLVLQTQLGACKVAIEATQRKIDAVAMQIQLANAKEDLALLPKYEQSSHLKLISAKHG